MSKTSKINQIVIAFLQHIAEFSSTANALRSFYNVATKQKKNIKWK